MKSKDCINARDKFDKILSIPLYAAFEVVEGGRERIQYLMNS